ncbi:hypothetical protein KY285_005940 [Solanum tuberosum]|nr:hypothetical protein KY285_005940 [Solanum tuberosum]
MASQPLSIPSSSDISLPFSTTIIAPAVITSSGATSTTSSSSSRQHLMIPLLLSLSSSVHVHSAPPNILPSSSMGQIGQPTLLPYAGSMEPPIPSIFHSTAA